MDDFTLSLLANAVSDEHSLAKAVAHFMFREIVEDIHAEGRISDAEMKELNKEACNRAAILIDYIFKDKYMATAFRIESCNCTGWDNPKMTADLKERLKLYKDLAKDITKAADKPSDTDNG